jgi:Cytochrome c554 and c-prime
MRVIRAVAVATVLTAARLCWPAPPIEDGRVTPSVVCGTCHRDIYQMWRSSAHAGAMEDVVFFEAYQETAAQDPATARLCLDCHAPLTRVQPDPTLAAQATWDGVSCDACHSLVSVELAAGGARQVFEPGIVKRGPIRDAVSMGHETLYSALHTSALVCAGCHEFQNREATPIITTYSEWQESAAGRAGKTCQVCHMTATRADVVDPKVKRVTGEVNLHQMPGGHSLVQLNRALEVAMDAIWQGDGLELSVRLTNKGAGHAVPTGMPGRRVILAVSVRTSDGHSFVSRRVYTKTFHDGEGQVITRDGAVFAPGVRLGTDSRIKADEARTETFTVPVSPGASAHVDLKLHYEHVPTGGPENRTWLTFFTTERTYVRDGR